MLQETADGLYCPAGDFHVDPWGAVPRAVVTHAHGDHARAGSAAYLCVESSAPLLKHRFGGDAALEGRRYGDVVHLGSTRVSFHPAGHVLGSAQVRIEGPDGVWVAIVVAELLAWWDQNRAAGRASLLFCYTLGKAQRILAELALVTDRRVLVILVDTRQSSRIGKFAEVAASDEVDIHIYDHHPDTDEDVHGSLEVVEMLGSTTAILTRIIK